MRTLIASLAHRLVRSQHPIHRAPLVISKAEIDEGVEILGQALADVAAGRVSDEQVAAFAGW